MFKKISELPTRYEPLITTFGETAKTTFVRQDHDLEVIKKLASRIESSKQSKLMFVLAPSGTGKTTFIHSLEVFLADKISSVKRLPPDSELPVDKIPDYLMKIKRDNSIKVINFDGREAPFFNQDQYQTFLGRLNSIIRTRNDLLLLWPVNDENFAKKLVDIMYVVGGKSPFGSEPIYNLKGLDQREYVGVLDRIMQIGNWKLEDAAISREEVEEIANNSIRVGDFLDDVQALITERFDTSDLGVQFPEVVFVLSSGITNIREICRNVRRADSYYLEASRLLMYTKRSNVAEWWQERNKNLRTALPFVISLFNAQLLSLSGSSVVHAMLNYGPLDIKAQITGVQANIGNAKRVITSSELYKYSILSEVDNREYGSSVKQETVDAYSFIQSLSKTRHKEINSAVMQLLIEANGGFSNVQYEVPQGKGLIVDAVCLRKEDGKKINLEFHHKSAKETKNNEIAIYILEKLKEYSINYGLAKP
ncbi:hypothetical protein A6764_03815 [Brevibacillus sp. WF146]|uniref:hypothetical protein n=1 Tax=Brevibacillus sp. WF146 TaxID=319501 RepID=UPI000A522DDA|nr:hypothetical protein [Brevibacillus sp. WF146]UYZ14105.1 hypothetical protein A6764_03815 [Brevibacillus sp. WF146]